MLEVGKFKTSLPNATQSHLEKAEKIIGIENDNAFGDRISSAIKSVADSQLQSAQIEI